MHDKPRGRTKGKKKKKAKARDNGEEKEEERKFSDSVDEHSSSDTTTESHARIRNEKRKSVDADDANTRTTVTTTTTTTTTTTSSTKICRICMCEETESMPFVQLGCNCKGSMAFAHKKCAKSWFIPLAQGKAEGLALDRNWALRWFCRCEICNHNLDECFVEELVLSCQERLERGGKEDGSVRCGA